MPVVGHLPVPTRFPAAGPRHGTVASAHKRPDRAARTGSPGRGTGMAKNSAVVSRDEICSIVLGVLENTNLSRDPAIRLRVAPDAPIFGRATTLDSLGLVALLIDIEDALHDRGAHVTFADSRAMSEAHSPFADVPSLVDFIARQLQAA